MSHLDSEAQHERSRESRIAQEVAWTPSASRRAEDGPIVVAAMVIGDAAGSRGAAAALACAGAGGELASLLIDVGGRPPRPTLLASIGARRLEERLALRLPLQRVAARGQVCHLAVGADDPGLEAAVAAVSQARGAAAVIHLPPEFAELPLREPRRIPLSGVLLRADLPSMQPQIAQLARRLTLRELDVGILGRRLSWVGERRALFGALAPDSADGLPAPLVHRLLRRGHPAGAVAASGSTTDSSSVSHVGDA